MVSICCKKKFPGSGVRTVFICVYKEKYLECNSWGVCWFSKMVIISSPLRFMTSLALSSSLGFQTKNGFLGSGSQIKWESYWLLPRYACHYCNLKVSVMVNDVVHRYHAWMEMLVVGLPWKFVWHLHKRGFQVGSSWRDLWALIDVLFHHCNLMCNSSIFFFHFFHS